MRSILAATPGSSIIRTLLSGVVTLTTASLAAVGQEEPIVAAAGTSPEAEEGFVSLFDGKSLKGWQGGAEGWTAEDGKLVYQAHRKGRDSAGREGLKIMSANEYADWPACEGNPERRGDRVRRWRIIVWSSPGRD